MTLATRTVWVLLEKEYWSDGHWEWDVKGGRNTYLAAEDWVSDLPDERTTERVEVKPLGD